MVREIPPGSINKSGLDMGNLDARQRTSKAFLALWWRAAGAGGRPFSLPETILKLKGLAPKNLSTINF